MDWLTIVLGAGSMAAVPLAWILLVLRRRRYRTLTYHDTAPPLPTVTTGQLR